MLTVYGHNLSHQHRQNINLWLSSAWQTIKEECGLSFRDAEANGFFKIIDLKWDDLDIDLSHQIFVVDKKAHRDVLKALNEANVLNGQLLYGQNIVSHDHCFFYYSLSIDIEDAITSALPATLDYNWDNIIIPMIRTYEQWFPFHDDIPDFSNNEKTSSESESRDVNECQYTESAASSTQEDDLPWSYETESASQPASQGHVTAEESKSESVIADVVVQKQTFSIDVQEVSEIMWQALSEPSGGKLPATIGASLNHFEKMTFQTANGPLVVYPSNRMNKGDEGCKVCIKDLIVLIKTAAMTGSKTIELVIADDEKSIS